MGNSRLKTLGLACVALAALLLSRPERAEARGTYPDEIQGKVVFNGCVVSPGQIKIRAVPIGVRTRTGAVKFPRGRNLIRKAKISRTTDPHVLRFSVRYLYPRALYRIGISAPPAACGQMFWRGPEQGLALSGGRAITLEGFSAQTQVEMFSTEADAWVGADNLDFTDPASSTRLLRWRSALPDVTGGELQLSTVPFPRRGDFGACDEPEAGIFHRQALPAMRGAEWQELEPIDFGPLLSPGVRVAPDPDAGIGPITEQVRGTLLLGAPVYARVVPITAEGPACDTRRHGVHGWVIAAKVPQGDVSIAESGTGQLEPWSGQSYVPPYLGQPNQGRPALGEIGYRVIKDHTLPPKHPAKMTGKQWTYYALNDPMGLGLVGSGMAKPGETLSVGTWFTFKPKPSSGGGGFLSDFGSLAKGLATAAWSGFGSLVDYASNLTEEIKSSLASTVVDIASVVPGVDAACDALKSTGKSCDDVVKMGIEYGLTSMGVPPSLPNFEQLQAEGIDYLAAEIATQIGDPTGLSEEFTEQMLTDLAQSTMDKLAEGRSGAGPSMDWLTPYNGFDPAVWNLTVRKEDPNYLPQSTYIRVKPGNLPYPLYQQTDVHVPARFPASGVLQIPVVLQPSLSGIDAPLCSYSPFGINKCTPIPFGTTPVCEWYMWDAKTNKYVWAQYPCEWVNYVSIYYRDAWIQQKLNNTQCFLLSGISASNNGPLWIPYPLPPYAAGAIVPAATPSWWDSALRFDPSCP